MNLVTRPVAELQGPALDWAVWLAVRGEVGYPDKRTKLIYMSNATFWQPTALWEQCGPLIEKYEVSIEHIDSDWHGEPLNLWQAGCNGYGDVDQDLLTAVCRAIVASQLGDTVQVPEDLIQ